MSAANDKTGSRLSGAGAGAGKARWYWSRLRAMSGTEVVHRATRFVGTGLERLGLLGARKVPDPDLSQESHPFIRPPLDFGARPYCAAADKIVDGRFDIFGLKDVYLGLPPNWNQDPSTGTDAPLSFGKSLNYRDPELVGDIKYLWEPNRHQHLTTLAQAYRLSGERKYIDALSVHLSSWFDQCPHPLGPNWTSSLELGLRLISWSIVWQLLDGLDSPLFEGEKGEGLRNRWLTSIYQHCAFIRGHTSRYSSANNHLIGELTGLFVGAVTWPFWEASAGWRDYAGSELEREALQQNAPDGVNREQSTYCHHYVLDFLLIAAEAGKAGGYKFSSEYWRRIEAMLDFLASVMDVAGNVAAIGDSDDGQVFQLSQEEDFCPYRAQLAMGAVLFSRGDLRQKAGRLDDRTIWLLGEPAVKAFAKLPTNRGALPPCRAFPEGGYYILGTDFETPDEIRLIVDAGPLGYLSIAAHGHADALAYTLSVAGEPFLIDPGTYAYHTLPRWRNYFRGTAAHNTLTIDGRDQSVPFSSFMWSSKADVECEVFESGDEVDRFVGVHHGYERLGDPVLHTREIMFRKRRRDFEIIDTLRCDGVHTVDLYNHFAEDCEVSLEGEDRVIARKRGIALRLRIDTVAEAKLLRGDSEAPAGWVSPELGVKRPITTLRWRVQIGGTTRITTNISLETAARSIAGGPTDHTATQKGYS